MYRANMFAYYKLSSFKSLPNKISVVFSVFVDFTLCCELNTHTQICVYNFM